MTDPFQPEGGCACGAVRYRLATPPIFVNCCHCTSCQTETGSAFVINALIEADRVELRAGAPEPLLTPSESGCGQTIWRCPSCRVALWSNYPGAGPNIHFVRGGTLDGPALCPPDAHIFTRSKLPLGSSARRWRAGLRDFLRSCHALARRESRPPRGGTWRHALIFRRHRPVTSATELH